MRRTAAGVATFDFAELCSVPTGAADFLGIARSFHTIVIHNIPFLSMERLPEVTSSLPSHPPLSSPCLQLSHLSNKVTPRRESDFDLRPRCVWQVRRLITLIDVLYDHKVKLLCSAAAEPFALFQAVLYPALLESMESCTALSFFLAASTPA